MSLELDVVADTPDYSVDMKAGLESLQGISDTSRLIAEAILTKNIPERKSKHSPVRTLLKETFEGSFGQRFALTIHDQELNDAMAAIGQATFLELIQYFLSSSIFEQKELGRDAQAIVDDMGELSNQLVDRIRSSTLRSVHKLAFDFGHSLKFRARTSPNRRRILGKFDLDSASTLDVSVSDREVVEEASISRLNIYTGNGRLHIDDADHTVAFGFSGPYKLVEYTTKKAFSQNLDENNGIDEDNRVKLSIRMRAITTQDGKIVKYLISGLE